MSMGKLKYIDISAMALYPYIMRVVFSSRMRSCLLANAKFAIASIAFHVFLCALSCGAEFPNYDRDISWVSANSPENKKFDFSKVPGTVIAHSPKASGIFLGSPSICILPDGTYIASDDLFGKNWREKFGSGTLIYESKDRGITWRQIARVNGQEWASLFYHNNALYLIGAAIPHCGFVVKKSVDGGKTWTVATDGKRGVICRQKMQANTNNSHCKRQNLCFRRGFWISQQGLVPYVFGGNVGA